MHEVVHNEPPVMSAAPASSVIRYEHPLNERIRTLMRLEVLYQRVLTYSECGHQSI